MVQTRDLDSPVGGDLVCLICRGARDETPSIKTFSFEAKEGISHEAGQALTLLVPVDGMILPRTFSISSEPRDGASIEITVKAHPQGRATQWLHRFLSVGMVLEARLPRGHFTLARRRPQASLALISAGSGATPLIAMLRVLATMDPHADVAWFHASRDPNELLFAAELARLQKLMPNLNVAMAVTRPAPGWFGYRGRPTRQLLSVAIPRLARRDVFCCGPHGFMDEIRLIYAAEGGKRDCFHTEAFQPPAAPPLLRQNIEREDGKDQFTLQSGGRRLGVRPGETVLEAALRQGLIIPYACRQGLCGTCRVMKISGDVECHHQGGLSAREEDTGYILACSARPRSDVVIQP